ncbi:unnamed protein product [Clonostachys solani]|uniref:Uncharacterized protein n=1 Tax=Clonostachys solani TaxID=160281 RepID=A0A9P0ERQ3_9HYPO|nr:unnamed protein product [Clonostachys solani]
MSFSLTPFCGLQDRNVILIQRLELSNGHLREYACDQSKNCSKCGFECPNLELRMAIERHHTKGAAYLLVAVPRGNVKESYLGIAHT